mmetsp:Transcript_20345/g.51374  ORF Transcript_20345/g.51374 Transcript_20345/m.51374 type:complete len:302 (-) Transcript_20345:248-1153(-)
MQSALCLRHNASISVTCACSFSSFAPSVIHFDTGSSVIFFRDTFIATFCPFNHAGGPRSRSAVSLMSISLSPLRLAPSIFLSCSASHLSAGEEFGINSPFSLQTPFSDLHARYTIPNCPFPIQEQPARLVPCRVAPCGSCKIRYSVLMRTVFVSSSNSSVRKRGFFSSSAKRAANAASSAASSPPRSRSSAALELLAAPACCGRAVVAAICCTHAGVVAWSPPGVIPPAPVAPPAPSPILFAPAPDEVAPPVNIAVCSSAAGVIAAPLAVAPTPVIAPKVDPVSSPPAPGDDSEVTPPRPL